MYLADDVRLRRRVAVKMLDPALREDEAFLERFAVEMQSAAALRHPHIGAVHDWGVDAAPFVVGDHFDHGSLRDLLDRRIVLSPPQALQIALAGARALAFAHARGVVHRDIRPENLLFADDGRIELVDFGVARALAEGASTRQLDVTADALGYTAPEQVAGGMIDGRADVFAFAAVIVEVATGDRPTRGAAAPGVGVPGLGPLVIAAGLGPLGAVLARASVADPTQRLDAAGLVTALMAVADAYDEPAPLPLGSNVTPPGGDPVDPAGDDITIVGVPGSLEPPAAPVPRPVGSAAPAATVEAGDVGADEPGGDSGDVASEPDRGRRRWRVAWIVLALVVVLGGGVVSWFVYQAQRTPTHEVPDVDGLDEQVARQRLGDLGFQVDVRNVRRDDTVAGELVGVDPKAGTRLAEGSTVTLVISSGPTLVDVPTDLVGTDPADATRRLEKLGLRVGGTDTAWSEDVPEGRVMGLDPPGEQRLEKGSSLKLIVSDGPEPRVVPSFDGMGASEITAALENLGLVADVSERYDTEVGKGGIIGVDPGVGSSVERGSTVRVVISEGLLVPVPALDGVTTVAQAIQRLEDAGLVADNLLGSGSLSGRPAAFDPPAGELVAEGSAIDIIVR